MNYKKGHKIKPSRVDNNVVIFTDGTNEVQPSERSCIDYGYRWDSTSGTCVIQSTTNENVVQKLENTSNKIGGKQNKVNGSVQNSIVYGQRNSFEGKNKNILVLGDNNRVSTGVNDSAILSGNDNCIKSDVNNSSILSGVGAIAIRDNETIVGGFYNDGTNSHTSAVPFTVQSSKFVMHEILETLGASVYLKMGNIDYIPTHPNSKVHMECTCVYLGDTQYHMNSKTFKANIDVNSSGLPTILKFDNGTTLMPNNPSFTETNPMGILVHDNQVKMQATGLVNAKRILVADITLTEVIYR